MYGPRNDCLSMSHHNTAMLHEAHQTALTVFPLVFISSPSSPILLSKFLTFAMMIAGTAPAHSSVAPLGLQARQ